MSFLLRDRSVKIGLLQSSAKQLIPDPTPQNQVWINTTRFTDFNVLQNLLEIPQQNVLTLSGVNEIRFSFAADIAVEPGIGVAIIQPWYIKPAEISIVGHSYLGAFPFVQRRDFDAENIYNGMLQSLNEFSSKTAPGNRNLFQLQIINNPSNADTFVGFIRKFDFTENGDKPFLLNYTMDFVGKPVFKSLVDNGKTAASSDKQRISSFPSLA